MDRTPDSGVCSAPANISGECLVDIIIGWIWLLPQQHCRTHDLT
jgi:hypothetical protein